MSTVQRFRGIFIPPAIFHKLIGPKKQRKKGGEVVQEKGDGPPALTKTDLLLLMQVESMVEWEGEGCFASNEFLADILNTTDHYISDSIRRLVAAELMIVYHQNNKRYLETVWSRIAEKPRTEKSVQGTEKSVQKDVLPYKVLKVNNSRDLAVDDVQTFLAVDKPSPEKRLAIRLHDLLVRHRKLMRKADMPSWTKEFKLLLQLRTYQEIKANLIWYDLNLGKEFVPAPYCAKSYCRDFPKMEDAVKRDKKKQEAIKKKEYESSRAAF